MKIHADFEKPDGGGDPDSWFDSVTVSTLDHHDGKSTTTRWSETLHTLLECAVGLRTQIIAAMMAIEFDLDRGKELIDDCERNGMKVSLIQEPTEDEQSD